MLAPVRRWIRGDAMAMRYADQEQVLDQIASLAVQGKRCIVCVWGDSTFSASELIDRVRQRVDRVDFIPGVSSAQVACSRLGLYLERSIFLTLHVRDGHPDAMRGLLEALRARDRNVFVLPRPWDQMPATIAAELAHQGIAETTEVHVLERLSLPDERIARFMLKELAASTREFSDLTLMAFPIDPVK